MLGDNEWKRSRDGTALSIINYDWNEYIWEVKNHILKLEKIFPKVANNAGNISKP